MSINTRYGLHLSFFLIAGILVAVMPFQAVEQSAVHRVIPVSASSYAFTPGTIRVNPGDTVTLQLTSTDVVHGIYLDGYGLQVQSDPGLTQNLTFVADRPGTFRFRCAVTCGELHPFMIGKLQVGPSTLVWRGIGMALLIVLAIGVLPAAQGSKPRNASYGL